MKVAALFSGGKDSVYSTYLAQQRGWTVEALVSLVPERGDSHMFHVPNIELTGMLAEAMGIKHVRVATMGEPEKELDDLKRALSGLGAEGIVSGAIASDYQHTRIDRICHELGMRSFAPLWRWRQEDVLGGILAAGFRVVVVGVYADGLGREWLGRELDAPAVKELAGIAVKNRMNVSGEGGEFETLALDGPTFGKRVEIVQSETTWHGTRGELIVREARLADK